MKKIISSVLVILLVSTSILNAEAKKIKQRPKFLIKNICKLDPSTFAAGELLVTMNEDASLSKLKVKNKREFYKSQKTKFTQSLESIIANTDPKALYSPNFKLVDKAKKSLARVKNPNSLKARRLARQAKLVDHFTKAGLDKIFLVQTGASCKAMNKATRKLAKDPRVKKINLNYLHQISASNDTYYNRRGSINPYQFNYAAGPLWNMKKINADDAWEAGNQGDDVIVAVIDDGVDYTHPDLNDNILINEAEIPNNNIDDDGNGYIDDYYGYDTTGITIADAADPGATGGGHGTHVAGIIAAERNNNLGVIGVAPKAKILAVKVFPDHGDATTSAAVAGLTYAAERGADVINMSFGYDIEKFIEINQLDRSVAQVKASEFSFLSAVRESVEAGIVVVIAAGNDHGQNVHNVIPACVREAVTVGASTERDTRASFSNIGSGIDISAPGGAHDPFTTEYYFPNNYSLPVDLTLSSGLKVLPIGYKFSSNYILPVGAQIEPGFTFPVDYFGFSSGEIYEGNPGGLPEAMQVPRNTILTSIVILPEIDTSLTLINKGADLGSLYRDRKRTFDNTMNILSTVPVETQQSTWTFAINTQDSYFEQVTDGKFEDHLKSISNRPNAAKVGGESTHGYYSFEGTSMSAPHVAGAAAVLLAMRPELKPEQVRNLLVDNAVSINRNIGPRLDLKAAIDALEDMPEMIIPDAVTILSPAPGAQLTNRTPEISWQAVDDAQSYRLEIYSSNSSEPMIVTGPGTNFIPFNAFELGSYTVHVTAISAEGMESSPSVRNFTIMQNPPSKVTGLSLSNSNLSLSINWDAITTANNYRVRITNIVSKELVYQTNTRTNSLTYNLVAGGLYNVAVTASNSGGQGAAESKQISVFSPITVKPYFISPKQEYSTKIANQEFYVADLDLEWRHVPGAVGYKIRLQKEVDNKVISLKWLDYVVGTKYTIPAINFEAGANYIITVYPYDANKVRSKKYRLHEITVIEPNTSSKPRPSTPVNPLPIDTRNFDDTPLLEWIPSIDADYYVVIIDSPNIKDENGKRAVLFHSGRVRTNTAQVPANKPLPRTGLRITIKACFDNHSCYITRTNTNIAPIAEAPPVEVSDFTLEDLADGLFELSWTPHHDTMYYSLRVNIPTEKNAVAYNDAYIAVGRNILVGDDGKVHYKLNSRRLASLIRRTGLRHLPIRDAGYYRVRLYSNNSISLQDVSKRPVPARVNIGCGNVHVAYCN